MSSSRWIGDFLPRSYTFPLNFNLYIVTIPFHDPTDYVDVMLWISKAKEVQSPLSVNRALHDAANLMHLIVPPQIWCYPKIRKV